MRTSVPSVDLRPDHWAIVRRALQSHVPDREVLAFGSRATWTAKDYSDLDLAVMGEEPLSLRTVSALDEALGDSDLPFKVDVVDWARIDDSFRAVIRRHAVAVQVQTGAKKIDPVRRSLPDSRTFGMATNCLGETTIGALLARDGGNVKTGPFGTTLKAKEYSKEGVPLISVGEIGYGALRIKESTPRAPPEVVERLPAYVLQAGDIVFGRKGAVDRLAMVKPEQAGWFLGSDGIRLRLPSTCDARFIAYQLQGHEARSWLLQHATGTTMASLNQSTIERLPIVLPPLAEQHAIAHILGTFDDKIELNRRMSETLDAMARALFKSWFVDFDPVWAKREGRDTGLPRDIADLFPDGLVDSEMGEIPEGWEVVTLAERIEVNPRRSLRKGQAAPYLPMAKMPTRGHMPGSVAVRPFGSGMRFVNGDTLVARITPCLENGKTAFVDFLTDGEIGWGSTEYIVLRPQPPLPNQFAYCLARSSKFREFAIQNMSGTSGRQRVPPTALRAFLVVVPPRRLTARFGEVAGSLFERARNAGHESRTFASLRDALLPKLISGAIRVPGAEGLVESVP